MDFNILREKIWADDEKILFDEIIRCIESEAYRSAYVMIWVIIAESLKFKIKRMSINDSIVGDAYKKIENSDKDNVIIEQAYKIKFINKEEKAKLDSIRAYRNSYAHPTGLSPSKEYVCCDLRSAVDIVLSKPPMYSFSYINEYIENLSNDPIFLGESDERIIKIHAHFFFERLNPNTLDYTLKKLFEISESLIMDFNPKSKKCLENCLIFTESLVLKYIHEEKELNADEFLNQFKQTSCYIYSNINIWKLLSNLVKDRIFNYYIDFENNYLSKVDFINRFYLIYSGNLLKDSFRKRFYDFILEVNYDTLRSTNLDYSLYYDKIIKDLKTYNWFSQNPAINFLFSLDLSKFSNNELEIIGRNILQSAVGNCNQSKNFLMNFYNNNLDFIIPHYLIKGIYLEIFINENDLFRFKKYRFSKLFKKLLDYNNKEDIFNSLYSNLHNVSIKDNDFNDFVEVIDSIDEFLNENNSLEIQKLRDVLVDLRCYNIRKLFLSDFKLYSLDSFKSGILPFLEDSLSKEELNEFRLKISSKEFLLDFLDYNLIYKQDEEGNLINYLDEILIEHCIDLKCIGKVLDELLKDYSLNDRKRDLVNDLKKQLDV